MRKTLTSFLCSLLLLSGTAWGSDNAVFLMYHHVSDSTPRVTSVTPDEFQQHLDYLDENDFQVLDIVKVVDAIRQGKELPEKTVVITFDDAYRNIYENAFPMLKEKGWPFTIFVSTEPVDRRFGKFLTWSQIREMAKNGATIANHTVSHPHMPVKKEGETEEQWLKRLRKEVLVTEARIEDQTGQNTKLFAWPFGETNPQARALLTELGYISFGQQSGAVGPLSDFSLLPRYPMAGDYSGISGFRTKVNSRPLPVVKKVPDSATVTAGNLRPTLTLTLENGDYQKAQLRCYASNGGKIEVRWLNEEKTRFTTVTPNNLPVGRSRYNCTAPSMNGRNYYWYSHQWLRLKEDGTAID